MSFHFLRQHVFFLAVALLGEAVVVSCYGIENDDTHSSQAQPDRHIVVIRMEKPPEEENEKKQENLRATLTQTVNSTPKSLVFLPVVSETSNGTTESTMTTQDYSIDKPEHDFIPAVPPPSPVSQNEQTSSLVELEGQGDFNLNTLSGEEKSQDNP